MAGIAYRRNPAFLLISWHHAIVVVSANVVQLWVRSIPGITPPSPAFPEGTYRVSGGESRGLYLYKAREP